MNHEHNAAVCAAKSRIASHEVFAGIQAKKPPKIGDGGSLPPFNEKDLNLALTQRSSYGPVAFNVWHLNLHWSPLPGIIVNRGEVRRWGEKKLASPCAVFPFPVTVACSPDSTAASLQGTANVLSPMEPLDALFLRIAEELDKNASAADLDNWNLLMLQIPVTFEPIINLNEMVWRSLNLREDVIKNRDLTERRPYQKVFEVVVARKALGGDKVSDKALGDLYEQNVDFANSSEKIEARFVRSAMYVYEKIFSNDELLEAVVNIEESAVGKTPFDSVYKLEAIAQKAKIADKITWCIEYLAWLVTRGQCSPGELSVANLNGKGRGGRGLLDLVLYKRDILEYWLNVFPTVTGIPTDDVAKVATSLRSINSYTDQFLSSDDLSWLGSLSVIIQDYARLCEVFVRKQIFRVGAPTGLGFRVFVRPLPIFWLVCFTVGPRTSTKAGVILIPFFHLLASATLERE